MAMVSHFVIMLKDNSGFVYCRSYYYWNYFLKVYEASGSLQVIMDGLAISLSKYPLVLFVSMAFVFTRDGNRAWCSWRGYAVLWFTPIGKAELAKSFSSYIISMEQCWAV